MINSFKKYSNVPAKTTKFVSQYLILNDILLTFYTSLILIQLYCVLSTTIQADVYDRSLQHARK